MYENADIGRCSIPEPPEDKSQNLIQSTTSAPLPPVTTKATSTTKTADSSQSCSPPPVLVVDPYTLTFGDEEGDSYGEIATISKNRINIR
jgi:hypothetical protein